MWNLGIEGLVEGGERAFLKAGDLVIGGLLGEGEGEEEAMEEDWEAGEKRTWLRAPKQKIELKCQLSN